MVWTQFMDMHSGGGQKLDWTHIYIEAPENEAALIFQNRFGRSPNRVTCTCCGSDYLITQSKTLAQATGYERHCWWDKKNKEYSENPKEIDEISLKVYGSAAEYRKSHPYAPLEEYVKREGVKIIPKEEIKPEERTGELHEEGYVWQD